MKKQSIKKAVNLRHFFVCTVGIAFNGSKILYSFPETTYNGRYLTYDQCIESTEKVEPGIRDVMVVSITEMSEQDIATFVSKTVII